jgi:adenylate kinase family enzyme
VDRIAIIGSGGSGKTYLARAVGARLGAQVTHLDVLYYDRKWNTISSERFAALQRELVGRSRWVIDGNYASTLPIRLARADTVVFLDLPALVCLGNILGRRLRHGRGQHDAIGIYDRITWGFIRYIVTYRGKMRPRIQHLLETEAQHADIVVLTSRRAIRRYLDQLDHQHHGRQPHLR